MTKTKGRAEYDLTEGPLLGKILRFALPLMATGLLQTLYNASDMIVVGRFSPHGAFSMGAVGSCGPLINLLVNVFLGLSVGVGISVAQALGAKRLKDVHDTVHTGLLIGFLCGILVGLMGFFLSKPLLSLMGSPDTIIGEATLYMRAYFVGMPAMLVYNFLAAALRSSGDTKRPLIFLAIAGLINVALNFVMVVFFGMGAVGVGIATSAAQYASAIMIVIYLSRYDGVCKLHFKEIRLNKERLLEILRFGIPAGLQSVVFSISNVLIQSSINAYGDIVVAGSSAAGNIEGFVYVAMNSLYQTAMTFTGQHVGADKLERIKRIAFISVAVVVAVGLVLGGLCCLFSEQLASLYIHEEDPVIEQAVKDAATLRIFLMCAPYFLCGMMDVLAGVVRGMGKSLLPTVVSVVGSCLFRIIWIFTVCNLLFPGNIVVLYIAYPVTWLLTSSGHLVSVIRTYKELIRRKLAREALYEEAKREGITASVS